VYLANWKLAAAVFAAYGWPADLGDEGILAKLLALNLERAGAVPARAAVLGGEHPPRAHRD
jgi:hypothetical protein